MTATSRDRQPPLTGRRGLLVAVGGCVIGGVIVLLAAGRTWGRATPTAQTGAHVAVSATGHDALSALPALAVAALALAAAIVAARSWLRVVVGIVVVATGGLIVALALTSSDDLAAALQRRAFGVPAGDVHASLSAWAVVTAIGGAVVVVAGLLTVARGSSWPALGARYESTGGEHRTTARPVEPSTAAWDALDRGEDPTS